MEFWSSFELLNASAKSTVWLDAPMPDRCPSVRTFRLFPYPDDTEILELIRKDDRPRKTARALVEVEAQDAREAMEKSSDLVDASCWLLGLAQKNSVSYWGAGTYHRNGLEWVVDRKIWSVVRTEPTWSHVGQRVGTTQLQPLLRMWLKAIDNRQFPLSEFKNSISLFLDSLRPEQFLEVMFLEAWIAFEVLVNEMAETTNSQLTMDNDTFEPLRKALKQTIKQNFKPKPDESYVDVIQQLSALQRVPVGHLIERFSQKYQLDAARYDIDNLKRMRNGLMHAGKDPTKTPLDYNALKSMRDLLEDSLIGMLGGAEVKPEAFPPGPDPGEDPASKEDNLEEYKTSFKGKVLDESGKMLTQGEFESKWTPQKLDISGEVEDPWALLDISKRDGMCSILGRSGKLEVSVTKAAPTRIGPSKLEMQAIHIALNYPR